MTFNLRDLSPPAGDAGCRLLFSLNVFPNPSRSGATLTFHSAGTADVRLQVFDSRGRKVFDDTSVGLPPGRHEVAVGGDNWASGLYIARLTSGDCVLTIKIVLIK